MLTNLGAETERIFVGEKTDGRRTGTDKALGRKWDVYCFGERPTEYIRYKSTLNVHGSHVLHVWCKLNANGYLSDSPCETPSATTEGIVREAGTAPGRKVHTDEGVTRRVDAR